MGIEVRLQCGDLCTVEHFYLPFGIHFALQHTDEMLQLSHILRVGSNDRTFFLVSVKESYLFKQTWPQFNGTMPKVKDDRLSRLQLRIRCKHPRGGKTCGTYTLFGVFLEECNGNVWVGTQEVESNHPAYQTGTCYGDVHLFTFFYLVIIHIRRVLCPHSTTKMHIYIGVVRGQHPTESVAMQRIPQFLIAHF